MARQSAISKNNGEARALKMREQGKTIPAIAKALGVSQSSVNRFLAKVDAKSTAPAHAPQVVEQNALVVLNLASSVKKHHDRLERWIEEAEQAQRSTVDDQGNVIVLGVDWPARAVMAKELRESSKLIGDLLERIYNAEQVAVFQEEVLRAVHEADPETARRVRNSMRERMTIRQAALLGV